jgi:hypothetical protein
MEVDWGLVRVVVVVSGGHEETQVRHEALREYNCHAVTPSK